MDNKHKPFLTIDEQIELLEKRNLKIVNKLRIRKYLELYNYQQFINGYNNPFFESFNRTSNKYRSNTTSESIISLFNYDRTISNIFISNIYNFERIIASKITYVIGENMKKIGKIDGKILDSDFNLSTIFKTNNNNQENFSNIIKILKEVHFNSEGISKKYRTEKELDFSKIPIWVLSTGWSFGTLCQIYDNLNNELKYEVINSFSSMKWDPDQFYKIIDSFRKIRNIISHNNVLFNIRIKLRITGFYSFVKSNNLDIKYKNEGLRIFDFVQIIDKILNNEDKEYSLKNIFCQKTKIMIQDSIFIPEDSKEYILKAMNYK